jgi:hypothetical protein
MKPPPQYDSGRWLLVVRAAIAREVFVMGKKEWRESSSGPDCLDVNVLMAAIGSLHTAHVALIVSPAGTGSPTSVDIAMSALLDVLPGSSIPSAVAAHAEWPNKKGTSFWGECYNLAWVLDEEISKVYKQESLWK